MATTPNPIAMNRGFDIGNIFGYQSQADADAQGQAFTDAAPRPDPITYNPIFNPSTMDIAPEAQTLLQGNNLDMSGLNAFQAQAESQAPSPFATQAMANQNYLAMNAKDSGAQTVAGQRAAADASLASRGGLTGGAAERDAQGGANNYLSMTQGVNQQLSGNDQQILMNDAQNKESMLGQLPGMQLGAANFGLQKTQTQLGAQSADIANQMQSTQAENAFNLGQYQQQMAAFGAGQTAAATVESGKHK